MREMEECDMERFGTLDESEKTIATLGDRWRPQAAKQKGDKMRKTNIYTWYVSHRNNVMSAHKSEVPLFGVRTALRLELSAWSMVKRIRQVTNQCAPPPL